MARKLFLLLGYNANHISYGYKANEHNPRWACLPFTVKIWAPLMLDTTRAIFIRGRGDEDSGCDVKGSQHSPSLSSFKIPCILFNRVQDGLWTKGEEGQVNNRISPSLFMESLAFCEKHRRNFVNWQKERRTGWTRESPLVHYSVNWIQGTLNGWQERIVRGTRSITVTVLALIPNVLNCSVLYLASKLRFLQ